MEDINKPLKKPVENFVSFADLWRLCKMSWRWFGLSLFVCLLLAFYYLSVTPKLYKRQAAIMVRQETLGKSVQNQVAPPQGGDFNQLGLIQPNTNVNNVLRHLTSLDVMVEVAKRLKLCNKSNALQVAEDIRNSVKVTQNDDKSTIINLEYIATSTQRATDVLNTLVEVYNEKWEHDKNLVARNSLRFIDARLKLLENDLNIVDDSISSYKSRHLITDLAAVSDVYLKQQSESDAQILRVNNRRETAVYIRDFLKKHAADHQLLPVNSGIEMPELEAQIQQYNTQVMSLNNHLAYSSDQNPIIINQQKQLNSLRSSILHSINSHIEALDIQLKSLEGANDEAEGKISSNPKQAKLLETIQRQQKVKESLYLYLLQKREETELGMTYNANITQIIDMPHGKDTPSSPSKSKILMMAILGGLCLPAIVIFLSEVSDTRIRDRYDIEKRVSIPLIGDVPLYGDKRSIKDKWLRRFPLRKERLVVSQGKQDYVNEAFRMIRSSLEFMTDGENKKNNSFIITSVYPGSGKTFISVNVVVSLALKGKKVLLVDGDLRRSETSRMWNNPKKGLSNYLNDSVHDWHTLLVEDERYTCLHILPVGITPPNPTELLSNKQFDDFIKQAKAEYDYVFVDCPPTENMADTDIMEKSVDRTLYVVRAGLFERKRLAELEMFYKERRFKHMSLILNGTSIANYFGYRYGYYHYGYHYENYYKKAYGY